MKRRLVLIGGGENGRPGTNYETGKIDKEIIRLTDKEKPKFLFIGHASKFADSYYEVMKKVYGDKWGCITKHLKFCDLENHERCRQLLNWADIIYVGGGNTLKMMNAWRKSNFNELLYEQYLNQKVLCGVSAGAICWCQFGNSDSRRFTSNSSQLLKVRGLGFIDILFCPHYNVEIHRQEDLKRMMKSVYKIPALAFDNGAALEIVDDNFKIITSIKDAKARKCYYKNGNYIIDYLEDNIWLPIDQLLKK